MSPTEDFVKFIVHMNNKIDLLEKRLNDLESKNRSAKDIVREISDKLREMGNNTKL